MLLSPSELFFLPYFSNCQYPRNLETCIIRTTQVLRALYCRCIKFDSTHQINKYLWSAGKTSLLLDLLQNQYCDWRSPKPFLENFTEAMAGSVELEHARYFQCRGEREHEFHFYFFPPVFSDEQVFY